MALAAGGIALVALVLGIVLGFKIRGLRAAQRAVLGDSGQRDLVDHAARLEQGFVDLRDWVEETATRIDARMGAAEARIDGCVAYRSLVRYDAYGEMSGHQSTSIALLDAHRSGVVMSSILHRENARVYVKQIVKASPSSSCPLRSRRPSSPRSAAGRPKSTATEPAVALSVAFLGPAGTYTEEALLASGEGGRRGTGAALDGLRRGHGRSGSRDRPRGGPDRELARGGWRPLWTRWRARPKTCASSPRSSTRSITT